LALQRQCVNPIYIMVLEHLHAFYLIQIERDLL